MINQDKKKIAIIGGGAAGFFTAINIDSTQAEVTLYEATQKLLAKVRISGGGRCNVTHNEFKVSALAQSYPRGSSFMKKALKKFQPKDTIEWFEKRGVKLVAEQDGRMFPVTNTSETIVSCLLSEAQRNSVKINKGSKLTGIKKAGNGFELSFKNSVKANCDYLVIATGGNPEVLGELEQYGHELIEPMPSLFTFKVVSPYLKELQGISFPKARVRLSVNGEKYERTGPVLITHWGLSGPAILKLSAYAARDLYKSNYKAKLQIDFLDEISREQLAAKFNKLTISKKRVDNLDLLDLPKRFLARLLYIQFGESLPVASDISKKSWNKLIEDIKNLELEVSGKGIFKEEFVTSGGVDLSELDKSSLESLKVEGLFVVGESLNVDGITGGFNFQNAWTSSILVSSSINNKLSPSGKNSLKPF